MKKFVLFLLFILLTSPVFATNLSPSKSPPCPSETGTPGGPGSSGPGSEGSGDSAAPHKIEELKITSDFEVLAVGQDYEAQGGVLPYTWSLKSPCGTIDPATGIITNVPTTCCAEDAIATITVTDFIKHKKNKVVLLPGGAWDTANPLDYKTVLDNHNCSQKGGSWWSSGYQTGFLYEGNIRYITLWKHHQRWNGYASPPEEYKAGCAVPPLTLAPPPADAPYSAFQIYSPYDPNNSCGSSYPYCQGVYAPVSTTKQQYRCQ